MKPVGYAVVVLGGISQQAVLPAFDNSQAAKLVAVVSGDKDKAGRLADQWAPEAVAAHRAIKAALDPEGLFNPGKKL